MRSVKWTLILVLLALPLFAYEPVVQSRMLVTTDWVAANLTRVVVVEVGSTRETYERGHIPGAVFLPLDQLIVDREGLPNELPRTVELQATFEKLGVGNNGQIVVYGDSELAAARLFFTLDYLGHGWRTSLLDGGFAKWAAEGRPISHAAPVVQARSFKVRVQNDVLARRADVEKSLGLSSKGGPDTVLLIDARPAMYFSGETPGDQITRPGHIPGARNVCWEENLRGGAIRVLLPASDLVRLYRNAGVTTEKKVITYCRSGMEASLTYFVLRYLGFEPALYDGSFVEWSNRTDAPVQRGDFLLEPPIASLLPAHIQ